MALILYIQEIINLSTTLISQRVSKHNINEVFNLKGPQMESEGYKVQHDVFLNVTNVYEITTGILFK